MNKYEKALNRINKWVEPQDSWTEEDWEHYFTIKQALEYCSMVEEKNKNAKEV